MLGPDLVMVALQAMFDAQEEAFEAYEIENFLALVQMCMKP